MPWEGRTGRRYSVLVLVIAAHASLVVLLLERQDRLNMPRDNPASPLVFLTLPAPVPRPDTAVAPPAAKAQPSLAPPKRAPSTPTDSSNDFDLRALPYAPDSVPLGLGIDWDNQTQLVANAQAASIFKELKHLCEQAALRGETPPGCRHYRAPDPWKPEPNKFGFAGALPYMRLGKHCVIGLGFFGCGVGPYPPADGHVLDDMRDPDRPRSSVPDPNEQP